MDEFWKSCTEAIKKRASTALLGTYTFFWLVFHWQGLYVTFFVNQDLIYERYHLLKNEYVNKYFFGYYGWHFYLGLIIPAILTYLFIWVLPKLIFIHAFEQERDYRLLKQKIVIDNEIKIESHRAELAKQNEKTLKAEVKVVQKEKAIEELDPKKAWQKEYDRFNSSGLVGSLNQVAESIYKHGGRVDTYYDKERGKRVGIDVDRDSVAIAHTNGLIDMHDDRMSLTEKGRFFLGQSYFDKLP